MRIAIDLDTNQTISSPANLQAVSSYSFKRGDTARIEIQFSRAGLVVELDDESATGKFMLKPSGQYDEDPVVSDTVWSKEGTGEATLYVFEPNFNTEELNALLGYDPEDLDESDDIPSVTLMGEIEWVNSGSRSSTNTWSAVVNNDVIRGDEGFPTSGSPPYPTPEELTAIFALLHSQAAITVSTSGTTTFTKPSATNKVQTHRVTVSAGAGAYTRKLVLATTNAVAGDIARVVLIFAASVNPSVEIYNATDAGTLLYDMDGGTDAFQVCANFTFNGTAWESDGAY